jgi:KUP system potassium uptake protein
MDPISRAKTMDAENPEESGVHRPGDYKQKQVFRGTQLFFLAYQSIGVIYGDIGTSPLYVYSSVFGSTAPSRDDLIGVLSLIIWSLTFMVTIVSHLRHPVVMQSAQLTSNAEIHMHHLARR